MVNAVHLHRALRVAGSLLLMICGSCSGDPEPASSPTPSQQTPPVTPTPTSHLPIGHLRVTPLELSFGDVLLSQHQAANVELVNTGDGPLTGVSAALDKSAGPFALTYPPDTLPGTLMPGDSVTITITFTPVEAGAAAVALEVQSDDPGAPLVKVPCDGSGVVPIDADGDGVNEDTDCNDHEPQVFPGAPELCNARDDDCDGQIDEDFPDSDGDGKCDPAQVPDPRQVSTPLDPTVSTTLPNAVAFLYEGSDPVQLGVLPGTIQPATVAVLRGQVFSLERAPLPGATVSILGHPEFGYTFSRADGAYDMAVNGGGVLTVVFRLDGYLPVQRQVVTPWQDYVHVEDIALTPFDLEVTAIDLGVSSSYQVARGSLSEDEDGQRQATVLFPPDTAAIMHLPEGRTEPLETLHVRATEYTVGESGPMAMPGTLPPNSAYTYAVDLSIDEAVDAGATGVSFNRSVPLYLENFLDFPVGGPVPSGYYDVNTGIWVASQNGLVIEILAMGGGIAQVDLNGDGLADDASALAGVGITDAERMQLGALYLPGQTLWRVPVSHFSPYDLNWGWGPPDDAAWPEGGPGGSGGGGPPGSGRRQDRSCSGSGSSIECQNQVLGEDLPVPGTPFHLHYSSARVPGRAENRTLDISLTGPTLPGPLAAIELEIDIAGQHTSGRYPALINQVISYTWNGLDAYGRTVLGRQPVRVRVGFAYPAVYTPTYNFGSAYSESSGQFTRNPTRWEIVLWQEWSSTLGSLDVRAQGLGAWTLDMHHAYDVTGRVLHFGDGRTRSADNVGQVINTIVGVGIGNDPGDGGPASTARVYLPSGLAATADGSLLIAEQSSSYNRIRKVAPDGTIHTVAGSGFQPGFSGDGGPATAALLNRPWDVAVAPDGAFFIADTGNYRIRRVGTDGIITTVAGNGIYGYNGDHIPATTASLGSPCGLALGPDGTIYIADTYNNRVRQVKPDGTISTLLQLQLPFGVAVGPDGSVYSGDYSRSIVTRVAPDGTTSRVAGGGGSNGSGDGGPATDADLVGAQRMAVGRDGSLFIANAYRIRKVDPAGIITTIAGTGTEGYSGDGGPPLAALMTNSYALALGPDGSLYNSDLAKYRVRKISSAMTGVSSSDLVVPSDDGAEVYVFDSRGRHLRTVDALTNAVRWTFTYDAQGLLVDVTDSAGGRTTVARDTQGTPVSISSPYGLNTALTLNADGYLTRIVDPAARQTDLTYAVGGLLSSLTSPRGELHDFSYDAMGRLSRDRDPAGGSRSLAFTQVNSTTHSVALTTGLGRTTTFDVQVRTDGEVRQTSHLPDLLQSTQVDRPDGSSSITTPEGTTSSATIGPDPRFGMQAPVPLTRAMTTPGGHSLSLSTSRAVTLTNPNDLFSLSTLTQTQTLNGSSWTRAYDATTRRMTLTTPLGRQHRVTLDALGRLSRLELAGIQPVDLSYDARGRPAMFVQGGRQHVLGYDARGFLNRLTDPVGRVTGLERDGVGQVVREAWPDGTEVDYTWDEGGNVTSVTPPGRPAHALTYTPINQWATYQPPPVDASATTSTLLYDIDRMPVELQRPDGTSIQFDYDGAGRLHAVRLPAGSITVGYNAMTGTPLSLTSPDGITTAYSWDGPLLTAEATSGPISGLVALTWDSNMRITGVNAATESTSFGYDADGLLNSAGSLTLNRDAVTGFITGSSLNSIADTLHYDAYGAPDQYRAEAGSTSLISTTLTRDALNRIEMEDTTVVGVHHIDAYDYDDAGRLTTVTRDGATFADYIYDDNGNRTDVTTSSGTLTSTYDDQDRLMTYGAISYGYTANGELEHRTDTGGSTSYVYDALGNLIGATLPAGRTIRYLIDGENRRAGKQIDGVMTQGFLYQDQLHPVAELDGAGALVSFFVYGSRSNVPDFMIRGGSTYRILSDSRGSPLLVVNSVTGEIAQHLTYDPLGAVISDTNPGFQPFGFAGGLYDPDTRLVRFGARDYDPETGRWTGKEPRLFNGGSNLYTYAMNDPINWIDSDGNVAVWVVTGGIGLVAGAIGNAYSQLSNGGTRCFSWGDFAIAAGAGGAAGVAAPVLAVDAIGAAILGATSNLFQYVATEISHGRKATPLGAVINATTGALGGRLGGAVAPGEAAVAEALAGSNLTRALGAGVLSNSDPVRIGADTSSLIQGH